MVKKGVASALILVSFALFCNRAEALRKLPEVRPLIYHNVKYTVNIDTLEAWDLRTNAKLWELQIYNRDEFYRQNIKDELSAVEPDMWVYIDSLRMEDGYLIVSNELGDEYSVDLAARQARKRVSGDSSFSPGSE